jgi:HAD superfamily hydrolase (TIGR01509 family)
MPPFRAVLFDVDGTLVDSNAGHARAWVDALAESGDHVEYDRVRPLIGMGGDKVLPLVAGLSDEEPKGKKITERREALFAERYLPHVRSLPGARELLVRLQREGYRLAVASSSKKDMLQRLLALLGGEELFDVTTSSDDAESSKPDPDIVETALKRLAEPPDRVVMVGDTPYDIEAAARAGVAAIAFRSGGWGDEDLRGAIAIYDGPADLLAHFDESVVAAAAVR